MLATKKAYANGRMSETETETESEYKGHIRFKECIVLKMMFKLALNISNVFDRSKVCERPTYSVQSVVIHSKRIYI